MRNSLSSLRGLRWGHADIPFCLPVPDPQLACVQSRPHQSRAPHRVVRRPSIAAWRNTEPATGPGAPRTYADLAIECALVFKSVYHLSLRAAQGFLTSVVELMQLTLPIPDYSTVSRRQGALQMHLSPAPSSGPRHVVIDATGLKVYSAGEWHIRKHHVSRRRTWRKLHLGVDERTRPGRTPNRTLPEELSLHPFRYGRTDARHGADESHALSRPVRAGRPPELSRLRKRNLRSCWQGHGRVPCGRRGVLGVPLVSSLARASRSALTASCPTSPAKTPHQRVVAPPQLLHCRGIFF